MRNLIFLAFCFLVCQANAQTTTSSNKAFFDGDNLSPNDFILKLGQPSVGGQYAFKSSNSWFSKGFSSRYIDNNGMLRMFYGVAGGFLNSSRKEYFDENEKMFFQIWDMPEYGTHMSLNKSNSHFVIGGDIDFQGSNKFTVINGNSYFDGNVGIGVPNPATKLEINGNFSNTLGSGGTLILFDNDQSRRNRIILGADDFGAYIKSITSDLGTGTDAISFRNSIGEKIMTIAENNNVGIGTDNPGDWKLAENGKIRAKEIKVETGWSDFVFYDDYKLPSLEEVKNYIEEKGHLKDIPSAKEVEENGVFLGEMDSKLLQKIEELTLYTIEQEDRIKKLEELVSKLLNEKNTSNETK